MDHYEKAEHYLTEVETVLHKFDEMAEAGVELPTTQIKLLNGAIDRLIALAHVHATMASVQR
jgi:hypothetical protein